MVNVKLIEEMAAGRGLSIAALERKADIANGSVRRWEDGTATLETIQKVAKVLECTVDDLIVKEDA